jgi:hypothetical protein
VAAATFSESTPRRIGITVRTSLAAIAPRLSPGPSAPKSRAVRSRWAGVSRWRGTASGAGVIASTVNPAARTCASPSGQGSSRAYGTAKTSPMLTRTLRRYSGSAQEGESSTASTPRAATARKIAPRLVWLLTSSRITTRRAPARASAASSRGRRWKEASTPRCTWKPVACSSTRALAA